MKTATQTVLDCKDVSKDFPAKQGNLSALGGLTFSVHAGEFVSVVGPSGCGKSTLLRLIAGLIPVTSGVIEFGHSDASRPRTAMVFQSQGLFPWMNVIDNAAFGLEMQGMDKTSRYGLTRSYLERVGLRNFLDAYPHTLSGGMRQRVAIARAFLADPEILLMDEPFGMLDAQTRIVMQEELLGLWQERRHTVIYITHDIEEALFLGDRVLVMSGRPGRLLAEFRVDVPRPRDRDHVLAKSADIRLRIWRMLRDEVLQDLERTV